MHWSIELIIRIDSTFSLYLAFLSTVCLNKNLSHCRSRLVLSRKVAAGVDAVVLTFDRNQYFYLEMTS